MPALGKSLVFYFKYWTEMHRLCDSEGAELEGLPDPERTREMAQAVGDKASRQAADFLEACAPAVEEHFDSIGRCQRITSRKIVERNWSLAFGIWPKNRIKRGKPKMQVGIEFGTMGALEIIPWVWRVGGEEAEKKLEWSLKERVQASSQELGWKPGTVGLDRIQIDIKNIPGFDVDRDPLVQQVQKVFRAFSTQDLENLWPK
jgi:hypothetical protein